MDNAMMEFYMTPGSCTSGIHILLEELELVFSAHILNLPAGDTKKPDYLALNPKGTIPTLVLEDGTALTDFPSIAWWLGNRYPKARMVPQSPTDQARTIEVLNYICSTIHGQGFTRIFTPEKYLMPEGGEEALKKQGKQIVEDGFAILNDRLAGQEYLFGHFTIADCALFYVVFWADRLHWTLPEHINRFYKAMCSRPVVRQVMMEEGYRLDMPMDAFRGEKA